MTPDRPAAGPLDGVRVLDLTRLQPGNYATTLLADLGADVIKVEEPGRGDYVRWTPPMVGEMSAMHLALNRNKRSVTLNLKSPDAAPVLDGLVAQSDALIESFRPGVMERLGFGPSRLEKVNPALVYVALTGYGQTGPYRDRVGHDINYVAINGILDSTGERDGPPVLPGVQIADLSGAMMAVIALLAALHRRQWTGTGDFIDVSMADASLSWAALHVAPWMAGGDVPKRGADYLNGGFAFYRVYRCADGKFVSVGALEPKFWQNLCVAIGREDLAEEQFASGDRRDWLHRELETVFASRSRDEWCRELEKVEACVAPVNDYEEASKDPQLNERAMFDTNATGPGIGVPVRLANAAGSILRAAPELGEHNHEVYEPLVGAAELSRLREAGVV